MLEVLRADIAAVERHRPGQVPHHIFPNLTAVWAYRLAHWLGTHGFGVPATMIVWISRILTGAELGWAAEIGPGCFIEHPQGIGIADHAKIGARAVIAAQVILGHVPAGLNPNQREGVPVVGDDVQIWTRASIFGPIHVGDGAIIGAHALVIRDVPAGSVARGVPARCYGPDGVELPR